MTIDRPSSSMVDDQWSFTDTHCHLDLRHFDDDRQAVIERAAAAEVAHIVNPAIDLDSCRRVLALAEQFSGMYAAVGVHPNDCGDFDDDAVAQLRDMARHPKVVAIDQQRRALRAQLALAAELSLPVILHSRSARGDESRRCSTDLLLEVGNCCKNIVRNDAWEMVGVWHAFSGDLAEAQTAYGLGLVLGLGGPVTFQNARRLRALVPQLRLDRLILMLSLVSGDDLARRIPQLLDTRGRGCSDYHHGGTVFSLS